MRKQALAASDSTTQNDLHTIFIFCCGKLFTMAVIQIPIQPIFWFTIPLIFIFANGFTQPCTLLPAKKNHIINCDRGIGFGLGDQAHIGGVIRNNMITNDGKGVDIGADEIEKQ